MVRESLRPCHDFLHSRPNTKYAAKKIEETCLEQQGYGDAMDFE